MPATRALMRVLACSLLALPAACASGPPADDEIAAAEVALTEATDAGADERAAASLALARDKLDRAHTAAADGENREAARLADEALVDAQLAAAQARSEVAREHADALRVSIEELRTNVTRTPTS